MILRQLGHGQLGADRQLAVLIGIEPAIDDQLAGHIPGRIRKVAEGQLGHHAAVGQCIPRINQPDVIAPSSANPMINGQPTLSV